MIPSPERDDYKSVDKLVIIDAKPTAIFTFSQMPTQTVPNVISVILTKDVSNEHASNHAEIHDLTYYELI